MSAAPRIVGVDVARGLAILGMFVAHAVPRGAGTELIVDGRSSILFATLAGVSLGIMTGADRPIARDRRLDRSMSIVLRALILFLLGLVLVTLDSGIAIILDYYGIMFLLLVPLLFLPRWALASLALVIAFVAPRLAVAAESADAGPIADVLADYLLTGYYPALVWLPYLLAGLIAARSDLRSPRTQAALVIGGAVFAVLGYGAAAVLPGVSAEAHSDSTAEVFGSGGVAIAVIGMLLWLTMGDRALGRASRRVLWPVAAAGSMALTLYTMQIVTLAVFTVLRDDTGGAIAYPGWPLLIGLIVGALFFASAWRLMFGAGPLERLVSRLSQPRRSRVSA